MYKYLRDDLTDEFGILDLQEKILEIMVEVDRLCRENGIVYFLHSGSALGAIRHKGFIPWDDDLDIMMDAPNYAKFEKVCEEQLDKEKFYFQKGGTKEYRSYFSKIRMNNTTILEDSSRNIKDMHHGIFIDIFPVHNAAPSNFGKKVQFYAAGLLKAEALKYFDYKTDSKAKKAQLVFSRIFVKGPIKKFLMYLVTRYDKKDVSTEYASVFGRRKFKSAFLPKKWYREQRYVDFEKVKLAVPIEVEETLLREFGPNYMTPKKYNIHGTEYSTTMGYEEYMKNKAKEED